MKNATAGLPVDYKPACGADCRFARDVECAPVTCNMSALRIGLNGVFGAFNESALFGFRQTVHPQP